MSPSSLLYPGRDDLKDSLQAVRGERAFGLESVFLYQDLPGTYLQISQPQLQHSQLHQERCLIETPTLSLFRVTRKAKESANLPKGRTRGLGQLHLLGFAQLCEANLSRGATPLPAPKTTRGGGRLRDQRSGLPRKLQSEALSAGSRGARRGALHTGGEAAKPSQDPDYFPLNEKQQQTTTTTTALSPRPRLLP